MLAPLLAVLLLTPAAPADDPRILEAEQLYRDVEFEKATIRFQEVALDPATPPAERAIILLWVAMCHAQVGDFDAARRVVIQAVAVDRNVEAPAAAPPRVLEMLADAKAAAPPPKPEPAPAPTPAAEPTTASDAAEPASPSADAEARDGPGALAVAGGTAIAVGGAALLGGGVLAALGLGQVLVALDERTVQRDVVAAAELANLELAGASVLAGIGAVVVAGGGVLLVLPDE